MRANALQKTGIAKESKLSVFASGNGDSILLEVDGKSIMTDINYREASDDEHDDEVPEFAELVRDACTDGHLNIFVLTHPDSDHLRRFGELFHIGSPDDHQPQPKDGEPKIIVDEIWCSPYALNPNYTTDDSKPLIDEIKRRDKLRGKTDGDKDGNRLQVMSVSSVQGGTIENTGISWNLLAPTDQEAIIPGSSREDSASSNPSSLVLRWSVKIEESENLILLCGDATTGIWERLHDEKFPDNSKDLEWHIMVAPHHCSRHSLDNPKEDSEDEYEWSQNAIDALSEQVEGFEGFIVASSKAIKRDGDDPPSWDAKQKYLTILARNRNVDESVKKRFLCTGEHKDGKPAHVIFRLTANGPELDKAGTRSKASSVLAVGGGGGYGSR